MKIICKSVLRVFISATEIATLHGTDAMGRWKVISSNRK